MAEPKFTPGPWEAGPGAEIMVGFLLEYAKRNPDFQDSGNANITLTRIAAALAKARGEAQ